MSTPMIRQYRSIKAEYADCILFFRMGDFYEMFFEDATIAAKELGLTLTSRTKGEGKKAPMAGVPHHAAQQYIGQLIEKGYRVAICEQTEDPKEAKGLVTREVVRVISPGTLVEENMLQRGQNNYIIAINRVDGKWGLAYADISTGDLGATEIMELELSTLLGEVNRLQPREMLVSCDLADNPVYIDFYKSLDQQPLEKIHKTAMSQKESEEVIKKLFSVANLDGFGLEGKKAALLASANLCKYLLDSQKKSLDYLRNCRYYSLEDYMVLDAHTRRNLELNKRIIKGSQQGSLVDILDKTETAMGSRLLKKWVNQPLLNIDEINQRLDLVEELINEDFRRESLRKHIKNIYDLERLIGRVGYGNANARDLLALKESCRYLPQIKEILESLQKTEYLSRDGELEDLQDIFKLLEAAIVDNPPILITEGGIIKPDYQTELQELSKIVEENKEWIAHLENREKERTGIKSLKVGFNRVFGYYIEVTRTNLDMVPAEYIRKQTLANAERFFISELKEKEDSILKAEEKIYNLEYKIFSEIRSKVFAEAQRIQKVAAIIAEIDVFLALSLVAREKNYSRPLVNSTDQIYINNGRHPVVENGLAEGEFVPNSTLMDCTANRFHIITGPNMAGKSTYLRQVALIVLMAQMGSFVPAREAKIGLVDRIFTRIGATDDLARGKSTFLVEMNEVAQILNTATDRSLILLDEVGRGTSTFDGLSIAWAVAEYINNPSKLGARTLFATHYHELITLEERAAGFVNFNVAVDRKEEEIIFLHVIRPGGSDESYGINVARLAGIPLDVIYRAGEILVELEEKGQKGKQAPVRVPLFPVYDKAEAETLLKSMAEYDLFNNTPLETLDFVANLQKQIKYYFKKGKTP